MIPELDKSIDDLKVLFTQEEIEKRVKELAFEAEKAFPPNQMLYVICVLKGSIMFCCDLIKNISRSIQLEFIRISSYGNEMKSSCKIQTENFSLPDIEGQNVLIVEDIIDTGLTARYLINHIKTQYKPGKLLFAAFLNKKCARKADIEPDLYGFEIGSKFAAGYGMDYKGYFRNLPYIGCFD